MEFTIQGESNALSLPFLVMDLVFAFGPVLRNSLSVVPQPDLAILDDIEQKPVQL